MSLVSILLPFKTQRTVIVMDDALQHNMHGATACRDLAYLSVHQDTYLTPTDQHKLQEYAVPIVARRHIFNPLRRGRAPFLKWTSTGSGDRM